MQLFRISQLSISELQIQSKAMKRMSGQKGKGKDIYKIAEEMHRINEGLDDYEQEVDKIIGAYCKVEEIRRPKQREQSCYGEKRSSLHQISAKRESAKKSKNVSVTSEYSKKVKQTLKEINTNRTKQLNVIKPELESLQIHNHRPTTVQKINKQQDSLKQSSAKKIYKVIETLSQRAQKYTLTHLKLSLEQEQKYNANLIAYWRISRYFSAWRNQSIYGKIDRERRKRANREKTEKNIVLASAFREFMLLRVHMQAWKNFSKKSKRQREKQEEQRRTQIQEIVREKTHENGEEGQELRAQQKKGRFVKQNQHLQGKLRGFLDDLKEKIDQKRLKTIKQYTEESEVKKTEQHSPQSSIPQLRESEDEEQLHQSQPSEHQTENSHENRNENHSSHPEPFIKKPLTNQELEKRRKQLQHRAKTRKQTLERKRRQKEAENQRIDHERKEFQNQIQLEQKKIKQQQYRNFMRKKHQQEQWQQRQKELIIRAEEFSELRIKKYYGMDPWKRLKKETALKTNRFLDQLNKTALKLNFQFVCQKMNMKAEAVLDAQYRKMDIIYNKKLKKRCIQSLKTYRDEKLQQKEQLFIRHEVYTLKIHFKEWFRVQPTLRLENLQYDRPRIKRADLLRNLTLKTKAFRALKQNKEEQRRNRNIDQHKNRIRDKIKNWTNKVEVDIDEFL